MLSKYWKSAIAAVGVLATGVAALSASTDFNAVIPNAGSGWLVGVGTVVVGALAFLKRNQATIEQVDTAIEKGDVTLSDLKNVLNKWNAPR